MRLSYLLFTLLLSNSFLAKAELRWFDIELIFFERPVDNNLTENLAKEEFKVLDYANSKNIIAQAYQEISQYDYNSCLGLNPLLDNNNQVQADSMIEPSSSISDLAETESLIEGSLIESTETERELEGEIPLPELSDIDYYCPYNKPINNLYELPLSPDSLSKQHTDNIYLLSADQLALNDIVKRLKRKGLTPILHTGWRQPESNIRNVTPIYLYGGNNLTAALVKEEQDRQLEQLFNELNQLDDDNDSAINTALDKNLSEILNDSPVKQKNDFESHSAISQDTFVAPAPLLNSEFVQLAMANQTWQLQGIFKVFIRKNYLNIRADFDLNELSISTEKAINKTQTDVLSPLSIQRQKELSTIRFSQFRRVISSQIHYFDHPRLGIVMQIRRYNH